MTVREILWGIAGILIGGFVGHRLALGREQRKEYNDLADKLFLNVDVELTAPSAHSFCIDGSLVKLIRRRESFKCCG